MKKTIDYDAVLDKLKQIPNKNFLLVHILKTLTIKELKDLVACISNKEPLISFKNSCNMKHSTCAIFISKVLPIIFEDTQIRQYFLSLLITRYNDANTWERPNKKNFFLETTGFTLDGYKKRNFYLGIIYSEVYDNEFSQNYFYPELFKQKTVGLINQNKSLKSNYQEFKNRYAVGDDSYLVYLDVHIIDRVGTTLFEKYISNIIDDYIKSLPIVTLDNLTNDKLLDIIFGYNWVLTMHLGCYTSGIRNKPPKHLRLHLILLKTFLSHTIGNYQSIKNRHSVYKLLKLNKKEIEAYENLSKTIDRQNRITAIGSIVDVDSIQLPSGRPISYIHQYIDSYFDVLKRSSRTLNGKHTIVKEIIQSTLEGDILRDIKFFKKNASLLSTLMEYIDKKIIETKLYFFEHNMDELKVEKDLYVYYFIKSHNNYGYRTIDLQPLNSNTLKKEVRMFLRFKLINQKDNNVKIYEVISCLSYLENKYKISKSQEIDQWHILECLHHFETEKKLKALTIDSYLKALIHYFSYLVDLKNYNYGLSINPAFGIKLANIHEHVKPTAIIPEDILVFLENHINELKQREYILIFKLLIETGWRFGDVISIKSKDIESIPNNYEIAKISVSSSKTKKARIRNKMEHIVSDVISFSLFKEITSFVSETQYIRDKYKIETLFYSIVNNVIKPITVYSFNRALNTLLTNHKMTSIDESYWRISSKQTRKTVASTLITNGAPLSAVQKKLGHVTDVTTAKYYAEVQQKKIGELNTKFYRQKFDIYIDEEKLKLFTEEERKTLYIDFCLNKRKVELGICSKHPSEGRCVTLGYTSCARCPKLCTGVKFLDKWEELANQSELLLNQFLETYKSNNIPEDEYKEYIEYKQELSLFNQYKSVIDSIGKEKS